MVEIWIKNLIFAVGIFFKEGSRDWNRLREAWMDWFLTGSQDGPEWDAMKTENILNHKT